MFKKVGTSTGVKFNRFKKWGKMRNSFFIVKSMDGSDPGIYGYILQENGAIILAENGAKLIIE